MYVQKKCRILDDYASTIVTYKASLDKSEVFLQAIPYDTKHVAALEELISKVPAKVLMNPHARWLNSYGPHNCMFMTVAFKRLLKYHNPHHIRDNMLLYLDIDAERLVVRSASLHAEAGASTDEICGELLIFPMICREEGSKSPLRYDIVILSHRPV